ncbi:unnamed protein product [marine sediment metagenome]|uniref:Uncharacterized protein n=1 Tax=marine sediment metagenome TaxID=412755 RepID=X0RZG5_9ZZZZ
MESLEKLRLKIDAIREAHFYAPRNEYDEAFYAILKEDLLLIRILLKNYLENSDKQIAASLEILRKKMKNMKFLFHTNRVILNLIESIDVLLYNFLEHSGKREITRSLRMGDQFFREVKSCGILIANGRESKEEYIKKIISALWTISYYLSPNWTTEFQKLGEEIDSYFSKEYALTKRKILED